MRQHNNIGMSDNLAQLSNSEKYRRLAEYLEEMKRYKHNKAELHKLYKGIVEFIKAQNILDVASVTSGFQSSSKWPNLLINTLMIYSTASGAISAIIPSLIAEGLMLFSFSAMVGFTFIVPAIMVLPYFIYKVCEDMSKQERVIRVEELILRAQKSVIEDEYAKTDKDHIVQVLQQARHNRFRHTGKLFNSTLLNTTYLFGTLFALGIAILTTFSLSTPTGWALIAVISLCAGIAYSFYHGHMKRRTHNKRVQLDNLRTAISPHEQKLFKEEADTKWHQQVIQHQQEIKKLQAENKRLQEENTSLQEELSGRLTPPTGTSSETDDDLGYDNAVPI